MWFYDYAACTEIELTTTLFYIDKLVRDYTDETHLILTELTIHRLMMVAIILSLKYLNDDYFDNKYYAHVGGITLNELNVLEVQMF